MSRRHAAGQPADTPKSPETPKSCRTSPIRPQPTAVRPPHKRYQDDNPTARPPRPGPGPARPVRTDPAPSRPAPEPSRRPIWNATTDSRRPCRPAPGYDRPDPAALLRRMSDPCHRPPNQVPAPIGPDTGPRDRRPHQPQNRRKTRRCSLHFLRQRGRAGGRGAGSVGPGFPQSARSPSIYPGRRKSGRFRQPDVWRARRGARGGGVGAGWRMSGYVRCGWDVGVGLDLFGWGLDWFGGVCRVVPHGAAKAVGKGGGRGAGAGGRAEPPGEAGRRPPLLHYCCSALLCGSPVQRSGGPAPLGGSGPRSVIGGSSCRRCSSPFGKGRRVRRRALRALEVGLGRRRRPSLTARVEVSARDAMGRSRDSKPWRARFDTSTGCWRAPCGVVLRLEPAEGL